MKLATKPKSRINGIALAGESVKRASKNGKAKEPKIIKLPELKIQHFQITVEGDSALICHAWSEKAKKMMLDKQMGEAMQGKEKKNPVRDFLDSLYWLSPKPEYDEEKSEVEKMLKGAKFGIPAVSFKSAAVDACSHIEGVTKVEARGAFHVVGDMVEIISGPPTMREDMVRVGMGTADIRYRGEFKLWKCVVKIRYNASVLRAEQIVNLFNTAGFAIGEWRPQCNGSFGMFHVG